MCERESRISASLEDGDVSDKKRVVYSVPCHIEI